ncbi:glycosyltransferase family 4 protein [Prochlorococcus marinus]|uniref:glycosyltransferase family 4 protein n=1 Tax=Prochlorococcus TaxID=1218 RepID=UPI0007B396A0|nr:glycosyltransferase family 4 protein [Prochlorococcus marinus]
MNLLVITNLYPPQELGGYGRSIADFVWGLQKRGHRVQVISSDAPHLGASSSKGPNNEEVDRRLQLKGTYEGGVKQLQDRQALDAIDTANTALMNTWLSQGHWDGVLIGNLDLIGPELLPRLLERPIPVQHHVGFVHPPFPANLWPHQGSYRMAAASQAVRQALTDAGLLVEEEAVIYPGARIDLFGYSVTGMPRPLPATGSPDRPLKVCFAGLLMASKGAHTLVEALIRLQQQGLAIQASLAGDKFQSGYQEQLEQLLIRHGLADMVQFVGQLNRQTLARFYALHHVGVFPSIHPEAFGIVAAEMMASGLALITSGVGGAAELIDDGITGLRFAAGDSDALSECLKRLILQPEFTVNLATQGRKRVVEKFSVMVAAEQLEEWFKRESFHIRNQPVTKF